MGEKTNIEWCDHSWSPWRGCTKVSPGCANCYAETLSKRNPAVLGQWGKGKPRVLAKNWAEPMTWNRKAQTAQLALTTRRVAIGAKPGVEWQQRNPTVFPSLCDWLDDEVPVEWLARFLKLIHDTPNLTWLLLTKRPENFGRRVSLAAGFLGELGEKGDERASGAWGMAFDWIDVTGPSNVWVGTSVEDQTRADQRIPALLKIPAVGRFLSVEPLLGPVDLRLPNRSFGFPQHITKEGHAVGMPQGIHWVIIGGESGHGARPCNVEWIRSLVGQCAVASVPAFVKQLGTRPFEEEFAHTKECWNEQCALAGGPDDCKGEVIHDSLELGHPKGGDPAEWPEDLRVREFPEGLR